MLKRISQIKNIGRFKLSSPGSAQFDKITLIFGRNSYGKSTLGDLLSSVESGVLDAVTTRKTIPDDGQPQQAVLSFQVDGQQGETAIKLNGAIWQSQLPEGLHLRVFDDGFYHNNVFAARQFTRNTKENFSSFVLGAQGVVKAQEIAEKNKQKRAATQERNTLEKAAFKDIDNLPDFLQLAPNESADALRERIDELRREHDALSKQQKNAATIQSRKEISALFWERDFVDALQRLNNAIKASLQNHHEEAHSKVAEHIENNFKDAENAEGWIRQGLVQNKGERCQFCGQTLGEEALKLLEIYRQSFDTSYQKHDITIRHELTESRSLLTKERISTLKITIESNSGALVSYPELEDDTTYLPLRVQLNLLADQLNEAFGSWEQNQLQLKELLEAVIAKKNASPHIALDNISADKLSQLDAQIAVWMEQYNVLAKQINLSFQAFKASVRNDSLVQRLAALGRDREAEARKLRRIELAEQCGNYVTLNSTVARLGEEIPKLREELRNEQSEFLDQFYARLNNYFDAFGSRDFRLEKGEDNSGHTPVYYLKVKFHGQDISERDLDRVFSESDRRALALSVFWAFLSGISENDKKGTIVVLDDPVTSFDNNRITAVHQEIVKLADNIRQVIVLSHYEQEIAKFLNTYRKTKPLKFLSIEWSAGTSTLENADIEHFIRNEHEKARENILRFISGEANSHNSGDLRIFLEYELNHRFAKQLRLHNANEQYLSDRIDRLKETGVITDEVAADAQMWRETLNPTHHIWIGNDIEDQRNTADKFMDFVYHKLVPS